jgi:predicted DNA-binding transcriptional regulator AlpA
MTDQNTKPLRLLNKSEVCSRVGRSFVTVWCDMRDGRFPRARTQGGKPYWLEHEIDSYIRELPVRPIKGEVGAGAPEQLSMSHAVSNPRRRTKDAAA